MNFALLSCSGQEGNCAYSDSNEPKPGVCGRDSGCCPSFPPKGRLSSVGRLYSSPTSALYNCRLSTIENLKGGQVLRRYARLIMLNELEALELGDGVPEWMLDDGQHTLLVIWCFCAVGPQMTSSEALVPSLDSSRRALPVTQVG